MSKARVSEENLKSRRPSSPFKDFDEFDKEIRSFANKYKTIVVNQAKRTSDYFEMTCFNYIVRYYELSGFSASVQNLQGGKYRYKLSPSGIQSNFSHFEISKVIDGSNLQFEIQHNLAAQSSHDPDIFTTPDISIIVKGSIKETTDYYSTARTFSFVENKDLQTFCEVKQFTPFPELLFNFIGCVNELKKVVLTGVPVSLKSKHLAPSLMVSGKGNKQALKIKSSLEGRYTINIIFDVFQTALSTFSKKNFKLIRQIG